jgi:hypothetical protein
MVKCHASLEIAFVIVKSDNLNFVIGILDKGPKSKPKVFFWFTAEVDWI